MVPWARPVRRGIGALCVALCLSACSLLVPRLEKPELAVSQIEWVGGNLLRQDFKVTLSIHNPNARSLPVSGLDAELRVGGESVARAVRAEPFVVPAHGDSDVEVMISADLARVLLKLAQQNGPLDYDLVGSVNVDLPFIGRLPFRQSGSLPTKSAPH